jgi:hypothetical protein
MMKNFQKKARKDMVEATREKITLEPVSGMSLGGSCTYKCESGYRCRGVPGEQKVLQGGGLSFLMVY